MLEPEQEVTLAAAEEAAAALEESETTMHGWQEQWDTFNLTAAEPRRQAEVQQSRLQQLETSLERQADRQKRLGEEREQLGSDPQDAAIMALSEQLAEARRPLRICRPVKKLRSKRLSNCVSNCSKRDGAAAGPGRFAASMVDWPPEALQQAAPRIRAPAPLSGCVINIWRIARAWPKV
jgi:chromosome segregation ATPase